MRNLLTISLAAAAAMSATCSFADYAIFRMPGKTFLVQLDTGNIGNVDNFKPNGFNLIVDSAAPGNRFVINRCFDDNTPLFVMMCATGEAVPKASVEIYHLGKLVMNYRFSNVKVVRVNDLESPGNPASELMNSEQVTFSYGALQMDTNFYKSTPKPTPTPQIMTRVKNKLGGN